MKGIALIIAILVSPGVLYALGFTAVAGLWGLYVLFCIPSIIEVIVVSIKTRSLPTIVGGPRFTLFDGKKSKT